MKKGLVTVGLLAGGAALALGGKKKKKKAKKSAGSPDPSGPDGSGGDTGVPLPGITHKSERVGPIERGVTTESKQLPRPLTDEDRRYATRAINNILAFMRWDGSPLEEKQAVEIAGMVGKQLFPLAKWPQTVAESNRICSEAMSGESSAIGDRVLRDVAWCDLIRMVEQITYAPPVI